MKLLKLIGMVMGAYSVTVGSAWLIGKFSDEVEELVDDNTKGELKENLTKVVDVCKDFHEQVSSEINKGLGE